MTDRKSLIGPAAIRREENSSGFPGKSLKAAWILDFTVDCLFWYHLKATN